MAIQARKSEGKTYPTPPKGRHQAVLIGIVDRGEQPNKFKDGNPLEPKLSFHFELKAQTEDDEPFQISKWVTNSTFYSQKTGKMSGLVQMLTEWLDVSGGELKPAIFDDLECLCGLNVRLRIAHNPREDGDGVSAKITSFEPWDEADGPLLAPVNNVGEAGLYRPKSLGSFWAEVAGTAKPAPPAPKPRPEPRTTPLEPDEDEEPISLGLQGQIRSAARAKLENDTSALVALCQERYGKKFAFLSEGEGKQLLDTLRAMPDADADESDPFASGDGEATEEEARAMLMPKDEPKAPQTARKGARAASEAY